MVTAVEAFDYVIVGAGSAGCVLANRLTASGRHKVLMLEAGPRDTNPWIHIPLGYGKLFYDPAVNWLYKTEPDPGLAGQQDHIPRGKVLGGSSSINAMVWIRGAREDYEEWEALGNKGWGWNAMFATFKALEDYEGGANAWRATGGPIHVSRIDREIHPLTRTYIEATQQAGLPFNQSIEGFEGRHVNQVCRLNFPQNLGSPTVLRDI